MSVYQLHVYLLWWNKLIRPWTHPIRIKHGGGSIMVWERSSSGKEKLVRVKSRPLLYYYHKFLVMIRILIYCPSDELEEMMNKNSINWENPLYFYFHHFLTLSFIYPIGALIRLKNTIKCSYYYIFSNINRLASKFITGGGYDGCGKQT